MATFTRSSLTACRAISRTNSRTRHYFYFPTGRLQQRPSTATLQHQLIAPTFSAYTTHSIDAKKSPHSKLLRVCSNRNINLHFAAIEADILQLNWDKAMTALVHDWIKQNKWNQLMELESNVKLYVQNNLPFLVLSWKNEQKGFYDDNAGMQLSDRIRMSHFPYERVVLAIAKHAISGPVLYDTKSSLGRLTAEIEARKRVLRDACKMLSSMIDFRMDPQVHHQRWTMHHESCSTCFRLIVSGWFLMSRRMRDTTPLSFSGENPSVEEEMYNHAKKWLVFCTTGRVSGNQNEIPEVGEAFVGGITEADRALLLGIAKGLSLSKNTEQQSQASEMSKIIDELL